MKPTAVLCAVAIFVGIFVGKLVSLRATLWNINWLWCEPFIILAGVEADTDAPAAISGVVTGLLSFLIEGMFGGRFQEMADLVAASKTPDHAKPDAPS